MSRPCQPRLGRMVVVTRHQHSTQGSLSMAQCQVKINAEHVRKSKWEMQRNAENVQFHQR